MIYIILAAIAVFFIRTIVLSIGAYLSRKAEIMNHDEYQPFVSVIVPSRNEENNIENCVNHLMKSDYPVTKFEIVAIDDRSSDSTNKILKNLQKKYPNIKIVEITESSKNPNLKGKAGALHEGIKQAKGEILMMTDADCEVHPNWIKTVARQFYDKKVDLIPSFTLIKGERVFDKVQAVEWLYMHTMASAGVGLKNPLGCFGNNLSIRAQTYHELGGYEKIRFSVTEDLALEQAVFKLGRGVVYLTDENATVTTLPCVDMDEYISQHRRWARGGYDLKWSAAAFVFTSVMTWLGLILSIISGEFLLLAALLITRIFGDFFLILPSMKLVGRQHLTKWVLPSVFFFMLMELIIPPLMINPKINWKGQNFK
mgnify:CR=1 FL=1